MSPSDRSPALLALIPLAFGGIACEEPPASWDCADYDDWTAGPAVDAVVTEVEAASVQHVGLSTAPDFEGDIPSGGNHYGIWAKWGEYSRLDYGYWTHNMEHGGIALLYHPCADAGLVDGLRDYSLGVADDDVGYFRWILTPYPGLPSAVAAAAWGWNLQDDAVDAAALDTFVAEHYRQAPEDVAGDGAFDDGWLGREPADFE